MSNPLDEERERIVALAAQNPRPCFICHDDNVYGVCTWIPDPSFHFAAGGSTEFVPVFAVWLCRRCSEQTPAKQRAIRQAIIRWVRSGDSESV